MLEKNLKKEKRINRKENKMYLNIDDELKEELKKEAKERGLTLTSYIRLILFERKK